MTDEPITRHRLAANSDHETALDVVLARAQRTVRVFDQRLAAGWNSVAREKQLRAFLLANRAGRLSIVVHDAANLQRDCPRLINLLRQFNHAISIHETDLEAKRVYDPFCIVDERDYIHRFHYDDMRGIMALDDVQGTQLFVRRFEDIWEASLPAVSATTLGL